MSKLVIWHKLFGFKLYLVMLVLGVLHLVGMLLASQLDYVGILAASYLVNTVFTLAVIGVLYELKASHESQLGYLFMATSMFKIATFFGLLLLYKPGFLTNESFNNTEALVFFIPYGASMIFEAIFLIRFLNFK